MQNSYFWKVLHTQEFNKSLNTQPQKLALYIKRNENNFRFTSNHNDLFYEITQKKKVKQNFRITFIPSFLQCHKNYFLNNLC